MKADDAAFPEFVLATSNEGRLLTGTGKGITVRDHIAIEAMNSLFGLTILDHVNKTERDLKDSDFQGLATACYKIADTMIAESEK